MQPATLNRSSSLLGFAIQSQRYSERWPPVFLNIAAVLEQCHVNAKAPCDVQSQPGSAVPDIPAMPHSATECEASDPVFATGVKPDLFVEISSDLGGCGPPVGIVGAGTHNTDRKC